MAWILGSKPKGLSAVLQMDAAECRVTRPFSQSRVIGLAGAIFGDQRSKDLWLVGSNSILHSSDSGKSWKPQVERNNLRESTNFNTGVALGNGIALVVGAGTGTGGVIYRTIDHGLHWDLVGHSPESHWLTDIYFWDIANGCAVGASALLLCTKDSGNTWETTKVLPKSK